MEIHQLPTDLLLGDLQAVIRDHARRNLRSQQMEIGPSEVGQECRRRVALTLLGAPRINEDRDEWTSTVGTALHTWMEGAFIAANEDLRAQGLPARWLVERTVTVRPGLDGHTDVYDLWTHTVLDHKFPGVTSIRKYRKQGHPGQQYTWQGHLYGMAWARMGLPVRNVAIAMYPRSGLVRDTWLWSVPYSPEIAQEALTALDGVIVGMNIAETVAGKPGLDEFLRTLPRDTTNCSWCQFYGGGPTPFADPAEGCAGPFEDEGYAEQAKAHDARIPGILP